MPRPAAPDHGRVGRKAPLLLRLRVQRLCLGRAARPRRLGARRHMPDPGRMRCAGGRGRRGRPVLAGSAAGGPGAAPGRRDPHPSFHPAGRGGRPGARPPRRRHRRAAGRVEWIGYLSTTGIYGDTGGAWVDETAAPAPSGVRGRRRLAAEDAWLAFGTRHGLAVHVFRLAGIYGPGRNALAAVLRGTARRIEKPGHVFSRIHVADIAQVLAASMARPKPGAIYNVCDDEPAAGADVVAPRLRPAGRRAARRWCRWRTPTSRRWRGVFMPTTGGSRTPASRRSWASGCAFPITGPASPACSRRKPEGTSPRRRGRGMPRGARMRRS